MRSVNCGLSHTDTEGSFLVERVHTMASALLDHISKVAKSSNDPGMLCKYVSMCVCIIIDSVVCFKMLFILTVVLIFLSLFATFSQKCI